MKLKFCKKKLDLNIGIYVKMDHKNIDRKNQQS
jgi:hypothetical protein